MKNNMAQCAEEKGSISNIHKVRSCLSFMQVVVATRGFLATANLKLGILK